jgi:hypothetical protein
LLELLFAAERIRQECCFVVLPKPSEETTFPLSRFGTIVDAGADAAGARLVKLIKTHVPIARPQVYKSFLLRDAASYTSKTVTDAAVFDLLVLGKIHLDLVASSFGTTPPAYYLLRRQVEEAANFLSDGHKVIVVHSFLANGKTLVAQGLAFRATQMGFRVLEFKLDRGTVAAECAAIQDASTPTLVIIEDYPKNLDVVERICSRANVCVQFVLTARTPTHLTNWNRLTGAFGEITPLELSVDRLEDDEVLAIDGLLERNGLLGASAALSRTVRVQRMTANARGEFLWLLDAQHIKRRLEVWTCKENTRFRHQLDNTKARLLLQRIADGTRVGKSFADFVEPSRILNRQARSSGQGYYPFRVASLYESVLPRIANEWSSDQLPIFFAACKSMAERLDKIDSRLADHPDIIRCRAVMKELLKLE